MCLAGAINVRSSVKRSRPNANGEIIPSASNSSRVCPEGMWKVKTMASSEHVLPIMRGERLDERHNSTAFESAVSFHELVQRKIHLGALICMSDEKCRGGEILTMSSVRLRL